MKFCGLCEVHFALISLLKMCLSCCEAWKDHFQNLATPSMDKKAGEYLLEIAEKDLATLDIKSKWGQQPIKTEISKKRLSNCI